MGFDAKYRALVRAALIIGVALLLPQSATACRLALALGLDASASVDSDEHRLMRAGLANALTSPVVMTALFDSAAPVAILVYEWSGRRQQQVLVDWTILDTPTTLTAVAAEIVAAPRGDDEFPTALGYALGFGATQLAAAPACDFYTLDISGDGENNEGFQPSHAFAHFPFDGVTVNGLAIGGAAVDIVEYYQREILRGRGAFIEQARDYQDFEAAMLRKLERELRPMMLGGL